MAQSCVENYIHLVFATKLRECLIPSESEFRLYAYLNGIAKKNETPILKINGMQDHLHILIKLHPSIALSTFVKELKAYSSSWMKKTMVPDFGWQNGYGAFSYSKSMLPSVSKYIENQKEHHKTQTFKDEINLLKSQWGIEWNFD